MYYRAQIALSDSVEFKLKNVNSGLVLGVSGMSETAGAAAVQWADNGTVDHLWHFMPMGSNQYNIENMYTHQVLGVTNASTANGAAIVRRLATFSVYLIAASAFAFVGSTLIHANPRALIDRSILFTSALFLMVFLTSLSRKPRMQIQRLVQGFAIYANAA